MRINEEQQRATDDVELEAALDILSEVSGIVSEAVDHTDGHIDAPHIDGHGDHHDA